MNQTICDAINNKRILSFTYNGYSRKVEPHAHGRTKGGNEVLRAYQISGGHASSRHYEGWHLFSVSKIVGLTTLQDGFSTYRNG